MSAANLTIAQRMALRSHFPAKVADDSTVATAYRVLDERTDATEARHRATFVAGTFRDGLPSNDVVAVGLLAGHTQKQGVAFLRELGGLGLEGLAPALRYFLTTPPESGKFVPAVARWKQDADRWRNAPVILSIIRLAELIEAIRRHDWQNFMQRQQLLERAGILVEALSPVLEGDTAGAYWCGSLRQAVAGTLRRGDDERASGAALRMLD